MSIWSDAGAGFPAPPRCYHRSGKGNRSVHFSAFLGILNRWQKDGDFSGGCPSWNSVDLNPSRQLFQNLIECLSLIQAKTAESNARWTIRIITGCQTDRFAFPVRSSRRRSPPGTRHLMAEHDSLLIPGIPIVHRGCFWSQWRETWWWIRWSHRNE